MRLHKPEGLHLVYNLFYHAIHMALQLLQHEWFVTFLQSPSEKITFLRQFTLAFYFFYICNWPLSPIVCMLQPAQPVVQHVFVRTTISRVVWSWRLWQVPSCQLAINWQLDPLRGPANLHNSLL